MDTTRRDTATTLFGHRVAAPIGFAPIGINRIYHPTGELSPAKVARELNLPYCLSSAGSCSIEDTARANGGEEGGGVRFFQLYWSPDEQVAASLLRRAADAGYAACILTTDTWQLGWRHDDAAAGNYAFYHAHGAGDLALQDPAFRARLREAGIDPDQDPQRAGAEWIDKHIWHGRSHTWAEVPGLMRQWKDVSGGKPFILKGIQSVADAKKAVEVGVDGIVVSNHAGRQVDGAIASLDALEKIVDAVGDKTYVSVAGAKPFPYSGLANTCHPTQIMYDSGIRGASDVFKALALGARFVFVGRLWVWGLSAAGEEGVRHVMKALLAEFDILMNVAGYPDLKEIDRDALESLPKGTYFPGTPDLT